MTLDPEDPPPLISRFPHTLELIPPPGGSIIFHGSSNPPPGLLAGGQTTPVTTKPNLLQCLISLMGFY